MPAPQELDVFGCELAGTQLVEASAGTGKTWNLCALVLRLLLERGLALPQILVVTFTNAATAELRERIRGRLRETLEALSGRGTADADGDPFVPALLRTMRARGLDDATMAARLDQALQSFDEAAIHTIHGLCQRVLADNASGGNRDYYMPLVNLTPSGDLPVIQDGTDFVSMTFDADIQKPSNGEAIYVDGRPV